MELDKLIEKLQLIRAEHGNLIVLQEGATIYGEPEPNIGWYYEHVSAYKTYKFMYYKSPSRPGKHNFTDHFGVVVPEAETTKYLVFRGR